MPREGSVAGLAGREGEGEEIGEGWERYDGGREEESKVNAELAFPSAERNVETEGNSRPPAKAAASTTQAQGDDSQSSCTVQYIFTRLALTAYSSQLINCALFSMTNCLGCD